MGPKHRATMNRLEKLSGNAFDRAYMAEMVKDHQKTVALFQREATGGKDPDLRSWASKTVPHLQEHLRMAQDIAGRVGAKTTASR
jgi:putative membrane protein